MMELLDSRVAEHLRPVDAMHRRMFEAAPDGLLICDRDTGEILDANGAFCLMSGLSRRLVIGSGWDAVREIRETAGTFRDVGERLKISPVHHAGNAVLGSRDGRKTPVEILCHAYHDGPWNRIQCNFRDATNHRREEAEIRRVQDNLEQRVRARTAELEAANRELEAFTYSVSHDLRAPLRHILGFVDLLEGEAPESQRDAVARPLRMIRQSARRMADLIEDLLTFSRIGRSEMHTVRVDLLTLVMEAIEDLQEETRHRLVIWEIHDLPVVWVDRSLMRQALVNLLSNAVKFTSTRPRAVIEIAGEKAGPGECGFLIRDNGIGFDPRFARKIFGVFERLSHDDAFEGTGIGLANVQRIVRRHGGRVWAEGRDQGGAAFHVALPAEGEDAD